MDKRTKDIKKYEKRKGRMEDKGQNKSSKDIKMFAMVSYMMIK